MLTCNRPQFINRAIESIVDQRFQDWELIVVHDGPEARTAALMTDWQARDSRIRYFHRSRMGNIAEANNFGLAQARGEYVAILDDDDYWATSGKLEWQVSFLDENPEFAGCGGGAIVVDPQKREAFRYLKPELDEEVKRRALLANPMVHSTLMYRRTAALSVGGYDERLAGFQDWDFVLKLGLVGKLYNTPAYLTYYTLWDGGGSFRQQTKNTRSAIRIVWKHRHAHAYFVPAFTMASLYHCYAHLPIRVRQNSYSFLARLKKMAFAERHAVPQRARVVLD